MENRKPYAHKVLIILFLTVLIVPTFVQISGVEKELFNAENRIKADFPTFKRNNPIQFLKDFKSYYKDNFGLRTFLSDGYLKFKYTRLNESPIPSKVIVGKNDFLFLGKSFSNAVNESLGFRLFSTTELKQIQQKITVRKQWLNSNDMALYIAIAPSKHSVYRENLPFSFPKKETRKEQLLNYIKNEIDFDIIDLGKQFPVEKTKHQIYRNYDSHWNDLGAFYASQTLLAEIDKEFPLKNLRLSDYKIETKKEKGDLSSMINLLETEDNPVLSPLFKDITESIDIPRFYQKKNISEDRYINPNKNYKVLLFRDSFASAMIPFIKQTFGETTLIWSHSFDKDLILKEQPDMVIMEYTERLLEHINQ